MQRFPITVMWDFQVLLISHTRLNHDGRCHRSLSKEIETKLYLKDNAKTMLSKIRLESNSKFETSILINFAYTLASFPICRLTSPSFGLSLVMNLFTLFFS